MTLVGAHGGQKGAAVFALLEVGRAFAGRAAHYVFCQCATMVAHGVRFWAASQEESAASLAARSLVVLSQAGTLLQQHPRRVAWDSSS